VVERVDSKKERRARKRARYQDDEHGREREKAKHQDGIPGRETGTRVKLQNVTSLKKSTAHVGGMRPVFASAPGNRSMLDLEPSSKRLPTKLPRRGRMPTSKKSIGTLSNALL